MARDLGVQGQGVLAERGGEGGRGDGEGGGRVGDGGVDWVVGGGQVGGCYGFGGEEEEGCAPEGDQRVEEGEEVVVWRWDCHGGCC